MRSMCETSVAASVCRLSLSGRWLATGPDGGYRDGEAAYNVSVPEGFERTDLDDYATERLRSAGFQRDGPVLFTGADLSRARGARSGPVTAVATVGLSNPARLPVHDPASEAGSGTENSPGTVDPERGTVNLLVATTRALSDGTLATLLGTAVEAKTATLCTVTGFSGTTTDAVAAGSALGGNKTQFTGSATDVGAATRVCVRDSILASLEAYSDSPPASVAEAEHGVVTGGRADIFCPNT
ncbi:MAG: adenosylcobinamide amidohydrolase [Haloarculaceae archaeon]